MISQISKNSKLIFIKTLHTLIWIFFNVVLLYLFYAAYTNQVDVWFWVGIGLIGLECLVLVFNGWVCPLTPIARRFSDSNKEDFDIYLPNWVAKHNKTIYSIFLAVLIIVYFLKVKV